MDLPIECLTKQLIKRGTILHSKNIEDIDHGKYFVIIGVTNELVAGFFFINSNIHPAIKKKQEQFDMQYPIKRSDYSHFLTHDSFICANDIKERTVSYLVKKIESGETKYIGKLKEEHMEEMLEKARESRIFSKKKKELYFYH